MQETENQNTSTVVDPVSPPSVAPIQAAIPSPQVITTPQNVVQNPKYDQGSQQPVPDRVVSWVAAEYIAHDKSTKWFVALAGVAILIISFVYIITKDISAVIALSLGAVILGIFARRPPRDQQFQLDIDGFSIGARHYSYDQFRAFSVAEEGGMTSVIFTPLKRFSPYTTIYFSHEQEDDILEILIQALPHKEFRRDPVDRLMKRIRF